MPGNGKVADPGFVVVTPGSGEGSELRHPLGITIVGGLLFSQALTLYTTPVIFLYLDGFGKFVGRVWNRLYLRKAPPRVAGA